MKPKRIPTKFKTEHRAEIQVFNLRTVRGLDAHIQRTGELAVRNCFVAFESRGPAFQGRKVAA